MVVSKDRTERVEVEALRGGETSEYGEVAYTTHESDGVDVVLVDGEAHHFPYGALIAVTTAEETES